MPDHDDVKRAGRNDEAIDDDPKRAGRAGVNEDDASEVEGHRFGLPDAEGTRRAGSPDGARRAG